jgi:hypothetical protein
MSKHLKYSKDAIKKGFTNEQNLTFKDLPLGKQEAKDLIYSQANDCRWWWKQTWKDESAVLPVSNQTTQMDVVVTTLPDASSLTLPPAQKDNTLLYALLLGAGALVFIKLVS